MIKISMKKSLKKAILRLAITPSVLGAATAHADATNTMDVVVGGPVGAQNSAYVSVTLCQPGTQICQTIPHILLDTGSTGLRITAAALQIALPAEQNAGANVAECVQFGGGDILWGGVQTADVILGGERAANVPVHITDAQYAAVPSSCNGSPNQDPRFVFGGGNGILGISPASTDCDGMQCPGTTPGKHYFNCSNGNCVDFLPAVSLQIQNPVALMPIDNNGMTLTLPPVQSPQGAPFLQGTLTLGIGTQANNQPAAGARAYATDPDGIMKARFQGQEYWTKFDTGTVFWTLPPVTNIPVCGDFLCASRPKQMSFTVIGADGSESSTVHFSVGSSAELLQSSNRVFNNVAWNNVLPGCFMLSMPFFFGRTIYVGINGHSSPLGSGPFYGF